MVAESVEEPQLPELREPVACGAEMAEAHRRDLLAAQDVMVGQELSDDQVARLQMGGQFDQSASRSSPLGLVPR
jgi:hypothetical protein